MAMKFARDQGNGSGRHCRQTGAPSAQGGQQQQQCKGVDDNGSGSADFANAKLADNTGDVATPAVARDLARSAAVLVGGEQGRGGGSAGVSGLLS